MNDKSPKQISRRDAIKILGAVAGASVLANLPGKWNKPELTTGVLPAHAQTSVVAPAHTLVAGTDNPNANFCATFTSIVTITPNTPGILMRYVIELGGTTLTLFSPTALTGTVSTVGGVASLLIETSPGTVNFGDTITVTWSFEDTNDGNGSGSQKFTNKMDGCPN